MFCRLQLFEDANVDKEVDIRRRILKDFNKQEEDFETLREYNDYLEMVEDIIFNLTNNLGKQQKRMFKKIKPIFLSYCDIQCGRNPR